MASADVRGDHFPVDRPVNGRLSGDAGDTAAGETMRRLYCAS
jgi:hypothetical protein